MQYNYQKYIKLLKYDDSFRKKTKFLEDENKLKYLELKNYSRQINEHLHWYQKNEYLQLIEDFLSFKINGKKFESKFCSMVEAIEKECLLLTKNYERLKTIELNPISFGFAKWISEIYFCCDELYSDFDKKDPPDFPFAKTEEQLRDAVKSLFPEIQKYF
jgi:Txe/YoeB family toxin of Txe-Axe toxin-antitoxin module